MLWPGVIEYDGRELSATRKHSMLQSWVVALCLVDEWFVGWCFGVEVKLPDCDVAKIGLQRTFRAG